jgi:hypothetical protein
MQLNVAVLTEKREPTSAGIVTKPHATRRSRPTRHWPIFAPARSKELAVLVP